MTERVTGNEIGPEYLGDGVYASWDGYYIVLAANDHRNPVIFLEAPVMRALAAYAAQIWEPCP